MNLMFYTGLKSGDKIAYVVTEDEKTRRYPAEVLRSSPSRLYITFTDPSGVKYRQWFNNCDGRPLGDGGEGRFQLSLDQRKTDEFAVWPPMGVQA